MKFILALLLLLAVALPASAAETVKPNVIVLAADPAETKHLWSEMPDVVKRSTNLLAMAHTADRTRP